MKRILATMVVITMLIGSTFAFAEDVYVTKNGKRYHKADCLLIKNKGAKPIALEDAQKKDLKPCRKCYGDSSTAKNAQNQDLIAKADGNPMPAGQPAK